jgi:hypothetical protein
MYMFLDDILQNVGTYLRKLVWMLALVLEHLYDAFENLFFSDDVHVPFNCSIKSWNMTVRSCADVGTLAATSCCNSENLFFLEF